MAGLDPLRAAGAGITALIDAEFAALAADAQVLANLLEEGDVVAARVLPSNGLTDLVDINGRRVAAALPPDLRPGDVVAVKVLSIDDGRITVRIVPADATAPGPAPAQPAPSSANAAGTAASSIAGAAPSPASATTPAAPASPAPASAPAANDAPRGNAPQPAGGGAPPNVPDAAVLPRATIVPHVKDMPVPGNVEARLAAARAARPDAAPPAPVPERVPAAAPPRRPFVAPPIVRPGPASPAPPSARAASPAPAASAASFAEPGALLRALRLPVSASNVALARMALEAPHKLPDALTILDRALGGSTDPRVGALRALIGFVTRIDPQSPALDAQVSAYVDHVVTGAEPKLAQAAAALQQAPDAGALPQAARGAEREVALAFDLKSQMFALAGDLPAGAAPDLAHALTGALTALTAVQLNAATLLDAQPAGIAFALPLSVPGGDMRAQIRIDRDAPEPARGVPLDGDNFHIAFVLETQHFGTVALDVVTVGRTVSLSVKTEAALAARTFGAALDGLTQRLQKLRYTVAQADAVVAPRVAAPPAPAAPPVAGRAPAARGVDRSA